MSPEYTDRLVTASKNRPISSKIANPQGEIKTTTFYVLLTVQPGLILVNNLLGAQFLIYVYFYSLLVSGSYVPIIRRISVSMRHMVYVTLCRGPSGMQEHMLLHTRRSDGILRGQEASISFKQ